jgi:phage tail-like protein
MAASLPKIPSGYFQNKNWPLPRFHFSVRFGKEKWRFQEVGNLSTRIEILKHRHGRSRQTGVFKIPGMQVVEDVTLKRGTFTGDTKLFEWFQTTGGKNPLRKDVFITLLDESGIPEVVWTLTNAFPVKIEGGNFDAKATGDAAVSIDSVTLTFEEMEIQDLRKLGMGKALELMM